ncbi:MAG: tetratricopeptide repeat protein [Spirochaetaceae bacterium]|jgi:hypothetical protein|nr:tetratricopeptide repeat protein [Spirochaetaceae bacterium]
MAETLNDKRIAEYTDALSRNPNDADAYALRGNAYYRKIKFQHP